MHADTGTLISLLAAKQSYLQEMDSFRGIPFFKRILRRRPVDPQPRLTEEEIRRMLYCSLHWVSNHSHTVGDVEMSVLVHVSQDPWPVIEATVKDRREGAPALYQTRMHIQRNGSVKELGISPTLAGKGTTGRLITEETKKFYDFVDNLTSDISLEVWKAYRR